MYGNEQTIFINMSRNGLISALDDYVYLDGKMASG